MRVSYAAATRPITPPTAAEIEQREADREQHYRDLDQWAANNSDFEEWADEPASDPEEPESLLDILADIRHSLAEIAAAARAWRSK